VGRRVWTTPASLWLVGVRDLQYRRRRFLIAVVATSVVFSMTVLMSGLSNGLDAEVQRIVASFHADSWVVARGASGPFTATKFLGGSDLARVGQTAGVRAATPVLVARATIGTDSVKDVNLIGYRPGGVGAPKVTSGRDARRASEVVIDDHLDAGIGDRVEVSGRAARVVGTTDDLRYNFGLNTIFMPLATAQDLTFSGQPLASAIVVQGTPRGPLPGLKVLTDAQVEQDLRRPAKSGKSTIDIINVLLWFVAAGIIASMVYLTALERTRDFAVLKATGSSNRTLFGALLLQSIVLSFVAALVAIVLALLLAPLFPFRMSIDSSSYVLLAVIAVVVGTLASLAGLRRAVGVDPALAFGGA
jgi:putative ABC transport system permease protein